jgi:hypothetical protein
LRPTFGTLLRAVGIDHTPRRYACQTVPVQNGLVLEKEKSRETPATPKGIPGSSYISRARARSRSRSEKKLRYCLLHVHPRGARRGDSRTVWEPLRLGQGCGANDPGKEELSTQGLPARGRPVFAFPPPPTQKTCHLWGRRRSNCLHHSRALRRDCIGV